ncbi:MULTISPECIES: dihydrofolate reductase family protein [unclassified Streptomyces]|uniref:dihydrofolate reductase family protein n=1 Tax=unclassified Streptomyces TaxID=2593676 RepID=UPI00225046CF|nr:MULTISPECIES: dihydrofolate reductase family protein [unclassified Streptomyces]MCX5335914.1 dihydrofolate reductase family protein [Streptomyces sp. NBC_00140]MCX5366633.1 dihydrofolate reductase family protein [Streptomyces sp. NBC_00124]
MKLTTITNVSVDGVTQGHRRIDAGTRSEAGAPDEDGSGGFERFGWAPPLLDDEASRFIGGAFQRADAFLFGRRTYEIFAGSWGAGMDPGNPVGDALNARPKYVASTTLTDPQWAGTTVLSGDVAGAIGELRAEPGGELQVWGSGTLIRWLLDHRLVDEIVLLTYPVVVGQGTRLFPTTGPDTGLELVDLQSTPNGLTIQTYRTTGRPRYETATT